MKEWFSAFGIDGPNMLAGFSGGIVRVIFDQKSRPAQVCGTLAVGTLVAVYLGPPVAETLHLPASWHLGVGFVIGFGGVEFLARIATMIMSKMGVTAAEQKGPANVG